MKNEKLLKTILFSLILSISVYSCSKDDDLNQISKSNITQIGSKQKPKFIQKSGNTISSSFVIYAEAHNDCLDFIADHIDFPNLTVSEIIDLADDFMETEFSTTIDEPSSYTYSMTTLKYFVENETSFSTAAANYAESIDAYLMDYMSLTTYNFNDFETDLLDLETTIFNSSIALEEKKYLIGICAFARYSGNYWKDASTDILHPYYGVTTPKNSSSGFPTEYLSAIYGGNTGATASTDLSPWSIAAYDLYEWARYSADCPGNEDPNGCYETTAFQAGIASSVWASS
jgi:hypothetical protein